MKKILRCMLIVCCLLQTQVMTAKPKMSSTTTIFASIDSVTSTPRITEQKTNKNQPKTGRGKRLTLKTGLIMLGSGLSSTITGGALIGSIEEYEAEETKLLLGAGMILLGVTGSISGLIVTVVGLAMPN